MFSAGGAWQCFLYSNTISLKPDVYKAILKQVLEIAPKTSYRQHNAVREWAVSSYMFLVSIQATVPHPKQAKGRMIERDYLKQRKQTKFSYVQWV